MNVARGVELSLSAAPERPEVRYWKACENCQQRPVTEVMPRTPGGLPEIRGGDQTELRVLLCRTCWFDIAG